MRKEFTVFLEFGSCKYTSGRGECQTNFESRCLHIQAISNFTSEVGCNWSKLMTRIALRSRSCENSHMKSSRLSIWREPKKVSWRQNLNCEASDNMCSGTVSVVLYRIQTRFTYLEKYSGESLWFSLSLADTFINISHGREVYPQHVSW